MTTLLVLVALAATTAVVTWVAGWWAVLAAAFVAGAACHRDRGRAGLVAAAAALGWAALLLVDARDGQLGALATLLGGVFPVPGAALLAVSLLFIAAGAWSTAVVGAAIASRAMRSRMQTHTH